ncbi:Mitochondrial distribution and morphology protein 31, mitochondrial precursor [Quaeritorhiza haematococci]|nr:Mitochondrial distribution and morphology protein 31, mitochondrial precursor [Quaeritorhiza haematococci]
MVTIDIAHNFGLSTLSSSDMAQTGTTTFVSLLLVLANSLQFQGYVAKRISDYLTRETGFNITFESAIVPNWREGTIRLKNVQVLCNADTWTELKREEKKAKGLGDLVDGEVDVNWTYWDLTIKSVDVTLSLWRWLEGRGLLKEAIMKGARGAVDRRHIWWDPNWKPARRNALPGDFELDRFVVEDLQISILNPGFRPYTVSIFNGELPLFRKQWLLYDMMCADSIVGTFDGCLFSVHKLQRDDTNKEHWDKVSNLKINNVPIAHFNQGVSGPFGWVTKGNLDIDLNVLIPQAPGDAIFSIIKDEFKDIKEKAMDKIEEVIRRHPNAKWGGEWRDRRDMRVDGDEDDDTDALAMVTAVTSRGPRSYGLQYAKRELPGIRSVETTDTGSDSSLALVATSPEDASQSGDLDQGPHAMDDETRPSFVMFGKVRMNNLKASVPLATNDISYISNAMIRPIVAYMNANRTSIPVTFAAKMDLANFDGAWTIYEAGLVDVLSEEVGQSLTQLVRDERERARQLKRVGLWSLQSVTKNLMVAVDYARGLRGWAHFTTLSEFGGPFHVAD